jgi:hypothetical protein
VAQRWSSPVGDDADSVSGIGMDVPGRFGVRRRGAEPCAGESRIHGSTGEHWKRTERTAAPPTADAIGAPPPTLVTALVRAACGRRDRAGIVWHRRWALGTGGTTLGPGVPKTPAKGAKPRGGETIFSRCCRCFRRWCVAHGSGGQGVAGSNPASPTSAESVPWDIIVAGQKRSRGVSAPVTTLSDLMGTSGQAVP